MNTPRKLLCGVYGLIALFALVGTWFNNLQLQAKDPVSANVEFWLGTLATPVSRSITVDVMWLGIPMMIWMVQEARKLGMRFVWLYWIFGATIAISVTVPVFMIQRERALAKKGEPVSELRTGDVIGVAILCAIAAVYTVFAIRGV